MKAKRWLSSFILAIFLISFSACGKDISYYTSATPSPSPSESVFTPAISTTPSAEKELSVHFIDVGQADAIFIDFGDQDMLIDAGNVADGPAVVNCLKSFNTDDIELLVATHPHEDHIGGMVDVLDTFSVDKILTPGLSSIDSDVSKNFETKISEKNIPTEWPDQGAAYNLGDAVITILSDKTKNYSDVNDFSIVLRLDYGSNSFLFAGDAESDAEHDIVASGLNLKADVLKVGHHGGGTSTTAQFLKAISPKDAVISVGADNQYGHPDKLVTDRLSTYGVQTWRTDEVGGIIFRTNGKIMNSESNKVKPETLVTYTPKALPTPTPKTSSTPTPTPTPTPKPQPTSYSIKITFSASMLSNNHVGNEWSTWIEVGGNQYSSWDKISMNVSANDTISIKTYACENDKVPDVGSKTIKIPVKDLKQGANSFEMNVTVTENRGRYSGNSAKWNFVITISR